MTLTPSQPSLADFPLSVQRKGSFGFAVAPLSYANQSQVFGGHLCERGNLLGEMDSISDRLLLIIPVFTHGLARGRSRTNSFRASEATNLHVSVSSMCLGTGAAVSSESTISFTVIPVGVHFINSHTAAANNARSQYVSLSQSSRSNPSGVRMDRTSRQTTQRVLSEMFIIVPISICGSETLRHSFGVLFPTRFIHPSVKWSNP